MRFYFKNRDYDMFLLVMIAFIPMVMLMVYDRFCENNRIPFFFNVIYTVVAIGTALSINSNSDPVMHLFARSFILLYLIESVVMWIISISIMKSENTLDVPEVVDNLGIVYVGNLSVYIPKQNYTGNPIFINAKDITVVYKDTLLSSKEDFSIEPDGYRNNIDKGQAYLTISLRGNYEGRFRIPFEIV